MLQKPAPSSGSFPLAEYFGPPKEYICDFGNLRPVWNFYDGRQVRSAADWAERRREILAHWTKIMRPWPAPLENPRIRDLRQEEFPHQTRHSVMVEAGPDRQEIPAYLMVPHGDGPFPAVVVVYYEPETGAGLGELPNRDFGLQLADRGFVAISIGFEPMGFPAKYDARMQPLSMMAYVASNVREALAQRPDVEAARIGIVGHSYGGKWAMFASCLDEKFAAAVWSDPGVVFDESRKDVNYWDEWYLGYEPGVPDRGEYQTKPIPAPAPIARWWKKAWTSRNCTRSWRPGRSWYRVDRKTHPGAGAHSISRSL